MTDTNITPEQFAKGMAEHVRMTELLDILKRINHAFYVDGTSKALRPIMAETKALIRKYDELNAHGAIDALNQIVSIIKDK